MCSMTSVTLKPRAKEAMTQTRRHIAMINQNHFTVVTTETDARYNEMMDKTACSERWGEGAGYCAGEILWNLSA